MWTIRAAVIGWLRYEQRCYAVAFERSPWPGNYRPDIIGINRRRKPIEVEVKRTVADFKANAQKHSIRWRESTGLNLPEKFYFAVPPEIVSAVRPLLPAGAGLLTVIETGRYGRPEIECVVGASTDRRAEPIGKHGMAAMVMHITGSLHRAAVAISKLSNEESK